MELEKIVFEQRFEGGLRDRALGVGCVGRNIPEEGMASAKVLLWGAPWGVGRTGRRPEVE